MPDIVLSTFNAKYTHTSFGLRYLYANLGPLQSQAQIIEFSNHDAPLTAVEQLLTLKPKIIGFGVYIWNIDQVTEAVSLLKRLAPEIVVVIGGPEVSYEFEGLDVFTQADYLVTGEADLQFALLCQELVDGRLPDSKVISGGLPTFQQLQLPYVYYSDEDVKHRMIYVEASRGCPFTCEFCLSSLEIPVRQAELESFLNEMDRLLQRGVRQFKFIDRTFNLNLRVSQRIIDFFWERFTPDLFLHFEMIPDRLPESLRQSIAKFPPGALQFEVGIQTWNPEVAELISRKQDYAKTEANLRYLRAETGVHVHADLIVGLPGESLESFGRGFDRLVALEPQEIQVGMLKRLRGTPITRHDETWKMVYSPQAPYEVLSTRCVDFAQMQRLRRFARYWDLYGNSGNFVESRGLLWQSESPFAAFLAFSDWLYQSTKKTHLFSLVQLVELLFEYLCQAKGFDAATVAPVIYRDYARGGRVDRPHCLRPWLGETDVVRSREAKRLPQRQSRHLGLQ